MHYTKKAVICGLMLALGSGFLLGRFWNFSAPESVIPYVLNAAKRVESSRGYRKQTRTVDERNDRSGRLNLELGNIDTEGLLLQMSEIASIDERIEFAEEVIRQLANSDPIRAVDFACLLPPSPFRNPLLEQALSAVAAKNPQEAIRLANLKLAGLDRHNAVIGIIKTWAANHPSEAFAWSAAIEDPGMRRVMLETATGAWGAKDANSALLGITQLSDSEQNLAMRAIVGNWAQTDPHAALEWSIANYHQSGNTEILTVGLANAAGFAPALAAEFIHRLDSPQLCREIAPMIATNWVMREGDTGWSFATKVPDSVARMKSLEMAASSWVSYDPRSAAQAVESLAPHSEERAAGMLGLAIGWASGMNQEVDPATLFKDPKVANELREILAKPATAN